MAQKKKRVTIESALLSTMANNASFVKEFQFLSRLRDYKPQKKGGGCGGCSRTARVDAAIFNSAKQAISAMSPEKKKKMLAMLNTEQLAVHFTDGSGKRVDKYIS